MLKNTLAIVALVFSAQSRADDFVAGMTDENKSLSALVRTFPFAPQECQEAGTIEGNKITCNLVFTEANGLILLDLRNTSKFSFKSTTNVSVRVEVDPKNYKIISLAKVIGPLPKKATFIRADVYENGYTLSLTFASPPTAADISGNLAGLNAYIPAINAVLLNVGQ